MADYWDTQADWLAWLKDQWDTGWVLNGSSKLNTDQAFDEWNYGDKDWAFNLLCYAVYDIQSALSQFTNQGDPVWYPHCLLNYIETWCTLNMDTLLNVMLTAEFEQLTQFVGISDAYRVAIWDQPFNAQFYAALAEGFRR